VTARSVVLRYLATARYSFDGRNIIDIKLNNYDGYHINFMWQMSESYLVTKENLKVENTSMLSLIGTFDVDHRSLACHTVRVWCRPSWFNVTITLLCVTLSGFGADSPGLT
jgi:hypothetical protein